MTRGRTVPARLVAAGAALVLLAGGVDAASATAAGAVVSGPPSVSGVSPISGSPHGHNRVKVRGTGFGAAPSVDFGGVASPSVTVDKHKIIAEVPPGHGIVDVTVTTADGTSPVTPADRYSYLEITGVSPSAGPAAGGTAIVLTGSGFTAVTDVVIGRRPAAFTIVSDTEIDATAPAGPPGGKGTVLVFLPRRNTHNPITPTTQYRWV